MSEVPKLLPLGSAVEITDDEDNNTYVIIARGLQTSDEGLLAGYKGVLHPVGVTADTKEVVIRETQIAQVVHRGFENPEDAVFAKEQVELAKARPAKQAPVVEPDLTVDLSKPRVPAPAAPQAKTDGRAASAVVANPKDPFSELRSKGKRK